MKLNEFISHSLGESTGYIGRAIKGLSAQELAFQPRPDSNSIAFLLWHLARVEDLWINRILSEGKELYETDAWYGKFGTEPLDSGFGYDVARLAAWHQPKLELLLAYASAVRQKTEDYLKSLNEKQLDEPRDFGWSKGTVGSALSHLVTEVGEHSGQIGYLRGLQKGIEPMPPPPKR
jgi:uncharacterized damage-inducible protein DinB